MSETTISPAISIAVAGVSGRMGRMVVEAISAHPRARLCAAIGSPNNALIGQDAGIVAGVGELGVAIAKDLRDCAEFDVLVDFTLPDPSMDIVEWCAAAQRPVVSGTTGFSPAQRARLGAIASQIPLLVAPNMAIGVNLCFKLLEIASRALGDTVDIEIIEAHHRNKVDAPSGTAVRMGEIIAEALGRDLNECAVYGREGHTGVRDRKTIGFETVRAGDIVGEHTVLFAGSGERIELTHRAASRMSFASGAVHAACWLSEQPAGFYDMQDVLDLR